MNRRRRIGYRVLAQLGRASALQAEGRGFDPHTPYHGIWRKIGNASDSDSEVTGSSPVVPAMGYSVSGSARDFDSRRTGSSPVSPARRRSIVGRMHPPAKRENGE